MGFFSGVFDSDKLADAINTTKNATITGKWQVHLQSQQAK